MCANLRASATDLQQTYSQDPYNFIALAPALGDLTATKDEATAAAAALRAPPAHSKFPAVDGHQINSNSDAFTRAPLLTLPRASEATTT